MLQKATAWLAFGLALACGGCERKTAGTPAQQSATASELGPTAAASSGPTPTLEQLRQELAELQKVGSKPLLWRVDGANGPTWVP